MTDFAAINKMFREAEQALVPADLKAKGWIYRDMPGTASPEAWQMLLDIMGENEYQVLISTRGVNKHGEKYVRGQFLLSPKAIENLKDKDRVLRFKNALPSARESLS